MAKVAAKKKIVKDLNSLQSMVDVCASYQAELGELIQQSLRSCPDLHERFTEINEALDEMTKRRCALVDTITVDVVTKGKTVKGVDLQAVFSKGRITWDTDGLNGYAVKHGAIVKFRKIGKASVSIREVKSEEVE